MSENLKYFETILDANGYIIEDIPWVGYIEGNELVLFNNDPDKMIITLNNLIEIIDKVDVVFNTLNDADGYIIENIPFSCYIKENLQFLECNQENCKIVVENGVAIIKKANDIIRYTATSKVTPYQPSSLPTIISNDFDPNTGKGVIKFATDVTSIGYRAFYGCSCLTSVTIPNSVTSIGLYAFHNCTSLAYVSIPNSVISIGSGAFRGCSGLTSIEIPNSVTSIGGSAFYGCTGLTSPVYNAHVFAYMPTSYSGAYTIPDGIESIAGGAFDMCSGLTSVTIPNSVTSIGGYAFSYCTGLTSVTIGNSVTSIGDFAFGNCSSLISIVVKNGNSVYDSRNDCNAIIEMATNTLIIGCKNTTIPNSVTNIGEWAFYGSTGLAIVIIPNRVTSIGNNAFLDCTSLTSISYDGTISQYNSINKGLYWHVNVPATQVYCLGENPPAYTPI